MEKDGNFSILTDILPKCRQLNSLYIQIADSSALSFGSQCNISDFYTEFNDKQAFEKAILNLRISADKENSTPVITNLRTEINKNIDIYTSHKELFDGIDTHKVCLDRYNPLNIEIKGQLKDTNQLWQKLTQVRNSLESASWNNDKIATERLTREEDRLKSLYKKEQEKLEILYQQQKESDNHTSKYLENVFGDIYELGCLFISLLNSYFPIEKENSPTSEPTIIETEAAILVLEPPTEIDPEMIFRTGMFDKLLILEKKLITDKYLSQELHWMSVHDNGKSDIKRLVTFLVGLLENRYFLPGRDPKIKSFFESRYHISIGQNFEERRREKFIDTYKIVFNEYKF